MAISYVLVTAAAVVLVEGVVLGILLPRILASSSRTSQAATVAGKADATAKALTALAASMAAHSAGTPASGLLMRQLAQDSQLRDFGLAVPAGTVPGTGQVCRPAASVEALISVNGTVLASSRPELCPLGTRLGFAAQPGMNGQGTLATSRGGILWTVRPVVYAPGGKPSPGPSPTVAPASGPTLLAGKGSAGKLASAGAGPPRPGEVLGGVYAAAPARPGGVSFAQVRPLLLAGGVVLALMIPVGTVFGLLSTRRVIRRIKRLADVTGTVASGDFRPRVPVSGDDEIGRLEDAFNQMTGQLSAAVDAERARAGADARQAERARIARELHDSISQDLFSLSLLAAGLRRALHADPVLRPEVTAMERTSARTMREMQALPRPCRSRCRGWPLERGVCATRWWSRPPTRRRRAAGSRPRPARPAWCQPWPEPPGAACGAAVPTNWRYWEPPGTYLIQALVADRSATLNWMDIWVVSGNSPSAFGSGQPGTP
jgi:HAMP domain-containing protein